MRNTLIVIVFIFISSVLYSQTDVYGVQWVDSLNYDFGQLGYKEPAFKSFAFINLSDKPLVIEAARASCGCTIPFYSQAPIAPGDTSHIDIEYDTSRRGYFNKKVKIFFSDIRRPFVILVEGEVLED